jgi:quercetin dioxygenase-like cupin family protein
MTTDRTTTPENQTRPDTSDTTEDGTATTDGGTTPVDATGVPLLDADRLAGLDPYETVRNPTVGQEFRFLESGRDDGGEYLRAELRFAPDAVSFAEHVHPKTAETFRVLTGELVVVVDGAERRLGPGEQASLPAGVAHTHRNAPGVETRVLTEARPPVAYEELARGLAWLAREGHTDAEGTPRLLPLAVFLAANPDVVYLSSPPVVLQKLLFRVLAPVGRWRGYRTSYPPEPAAETTT